MDRKKMKIMIKQVISIVILMGLSVFGGIIQTPSIPISSPIVYSPASDFTYTTNNSAITITSYIGAGGQCDIPPTINELPVKTIYCLTPPIYEGVNTNIIGLTIPYGVETIGDSAFYCDNVKGDLVVPNSVTNIGLYAFYLPSLTGTLTTPNSLIKGDSAFYGVPMTKLMVSYGTTKIFKSMFGECYGLTSVTLPNTVKKIDDYAFIYNTKLTSINLGNSITNISRYAFQSCHSLKSITIPASVTYVGNDPFNNCVSLYNIYFEGMTAPTLQTTVLVSANNNRTQVHYPQGATGYTNPFGGAPSSVGYPLPEKQVTIFSKADSQPIINDSSMTNGLCLWMKMDEHKWTYHPTNLNNEVVDSSGNGNNGTPLFAYTNPGKINRSGSFSGVNSYVIISNNTLTAIGSSDWSASAWVKRLGDQQGYYPSIVVFNGYGIVVVSDRIGILINSNMVKGDSSILPLNEWYHITATKSGTTYKIYRNGIDTTSTLSEPDFGLNGKYYIGLGWFIDTFNGSIDDVRIYSRALSSNEVVKLYNLKLPEKKPKAVYQGTKLVSNPRKLNYKKDANQVEYSHPGDFTYIISNPRDQVRITGYRGAGGQVNIPPTIEGIPVTQIGENAFTGPNYDGAPSVNITGLTLPEGLKDIGFAAFYSCQNIKGSLVIPNSVTNIGDYAFSYCTGFNGNLILGNSIVNIGITAFSTCSGFVGDLYVPDSVISGGYQIFDYCTGFNGDLSVKTIIYNAMFAGCSGFKSLTLRNPTVIPAYSFQGCFGFTNNLIIPSSVTYISNAAFQSCTNIVGVTIPNSVTTIDPNAFEACLSLAGTITIPNSIVELRTFTFNNCSKVTGFNLPSSLTKIGNGALGYCSSLQSIVIPSGVTNISLNAFKNDTSLTSVYFEPLTAPVVDATAFANITPTAYYRSEASGYTNPFAGITALVWTSYPDPMP